MNYRASGRKNHICRMPCSYCIRKGLITKVQKSLFRYSPFYRGIAGTVRRSRQSIGLRLSSDF